MHVTCIRWLSVAIEAAFDAETDASSHRLDSPVPDLCV
jgi:hypothetical protein